MKAPANPFRGLAPFGDTELDALLFFGREREREIVVANLVASRLTVLYGPSGVGKSSLLGAAVVRALRAEGANVIVGRDWAGGSDDVFVEAERVGAAGDDVYLVLDQFEDYFLYGDGDNDALPALLVRCPRVNVLIALREDALAQLDAFKVRVPNVLGNVLRLSHLDRASARAAIVEPVERWNTFAGDAERVALEPTLVDSVLDETAAPDGGVEAPFLQLVMERLWETERAAGSRVLRQETLEGLGGAAAIIGDHLDGALAVLDPREQDLAAAIFDQLVTPTGTKVAHRIADLAEYARVDEAELRPLLERLARDRLLRAADGDRFEIFHDVLGEAVIEWRGRRRLERERREAELRQRRLRRVAVLSLAALAGVTALAVYAFVERGHARSQARHAQARELEATALADIATDPRASVAAALAAARLEPSARAEDALRTALLGDRLSRVVRTHGPITAVTTLGDGRFAVASRDGIVRLLSRADDRSMRLLVGAPVTTLVAARGGGILFGTADGRVGRWVPGAPWTAIVKGRAPITSLALDRRGVRLLVTRTRGVALVVRGSAGSARRLAEPGGVLAGALDPQGRMAVTVTTTPGGRVQARVFDARSGRLLRILRQRGVTDVRFSPDGSLLAVASRDGTTTLWRAGTWRRVATLDDRGGGIATVAFSPDGMLLATGSVDGGVRVWTLASATRLYYFVGHTGRIVSLAWSDDGKLLADGSGDGTARIWAISGYIEAGETIATLPAHNGAVTALAFSPDTRTLVSGSSDGAARIWDSHAEERVHPVARLSHPVGTVAFDSRGRLRAAGPVPLPATGGGCIATAFARQADLRAVGCSDGRIRLRTGAGLRILATAERKPITALAFSPDGSLLVTGRSDGDARVWDVATGRQLHALVGQFGRIPAAAFSSDGRWIATAGPISVAIWSAENGHLLFYVRGFTAHPSAVAWNPSTPRLAAGASDGTVSTYTCAACESLAALEEQAAALLARTQR